ncbi:MAG TPA: hypothetical protein VLA82_13905 [Actinomycetota bacterium]|nr:hypothetical protein [Actinomycetota bacterium]
MPDERTVRPEHASGVPSTASDGTPQAPTEAVGGFETANDPTGGATWIRRRFRLPSADGAAEALDAVLVVPGVARASLEQGARELVADIEPGVVSDDELAAAIGRGGIEPEGWSDERVPPPAEDERRGRAERGSRDPDADDIVEEESEDSFPASDAPSSWARSGDDDAQTP